MSAANDRDRDLHPADGRGGPGPEAPTVVNRDARAEDVGVGGLLAPDVTNRQLAQIASRQRGVVHRDQLVALGMRQNAIVRRVAAGRLHRLLPAVYAVGHVALPEGGREMAVQLWRAPHGVLSHETAAWIWGFGGASKAVHVSGPPGGTAAQPGTEVHRVRRLEAVDVRIHNGFRVTSPARTILDLAAGSSARNLERAIAEARVMGLVRATHLRQVLDRYPRRRGTRALTAMLDAEHEPAFTRSELERELLELVRNAGIVPPRTNVALEGSLGRST